MLKKNCLNIMVCGGIIGINTTCKKQENNCFLETLKLVELTNAAFKNIFLKQSDGRGTDWLYSCERLKKN